MKKKEEQTFKRQILGGIVYTALAVTVTAAAVGGIVSSVGKKTATPPLMSGQNVTPSADTRKEEPHIGGSPSSFTLDTPLGVPVTDIEKGVDAAVSKSALLPEAAGIPSEQNDPITGQETPETHGSGIPPAPAAMEGGVTASAAKEDRSVPVSEEPEETYTGYGGYIRPCIGYVSREYAPDTPIYSPTMLDYRTHAGVDIACDIGTPVRAAASGVVKEINTDALYGTTLAVAHEDGAVSVYANLSPDLPAGIEEGTRVMAGDVIAGVGETAACECAEVSHLHFELWQDAKPVDPGDYLP